MMFGLSTGYWSRALLGGGCGAVVGLWCSLCTTDLGNRFSRVALGVARQRIALLRGAVCFAVALPAHAADVPSGQPVTLHEVLVDEVQVTAQKTDIWLRFRFVAPQIARETGTVDYATAEPDMQHLCETVALSYLKDFTLEGDMIVISLSDRKTEFGTPDPAATQFFEAYRPVDNSCIWEGL